METTPDQHGDDQGSTSPPDETHEATTPPGNPEVDEQAAQTARDELEQAGGGH
jgi:hypothetical protein